MDNFIKWKNSNQIDDLDLYLVKMIKKSGGLPEINGRDNALRKEFLESAKERVKNLKQMGLLNEKLEFNIQKLGKARTIVRRIEIDE